MSLISGNSVRVEKVAFLSKQDVSLYLDYSDRSFTSLNIHITNCISSLSKLLSL